MFFNVAGGASDPASVLVQASDFATISTPAENEDRTRSTGTPQREQANIGESLIPCRTANRFGQYNDSKQYSATYS